MGLMKVSLIDGITESLDKVGTSQQAIATILTSCGYLKIR